MPELIELSPIEETTLNCIIEACERCKKENVLPVHARHLVVVEQVVAIMIRGFDFNESGMRAMRLRLGGEAAKAIERLTELRLIRKYEAINTYCYYVETDN